jgi:hypothetical protein
MEMGRVPCVKKKGGFLIAKQQSRNRACSQTVNSFWGTNQILVSSKGKHRDLDFVQMLFEEKGTSPVAQPAITERGRKL